MSSHDHLYEAEPQDCTDIEASLFDCLESLQAGIERDFSMLIEHSPMSALEMLARLARKANMATKH